MHRPILKYILIKIGTKSRGGNVICKSTQIDDQILSGSILRFWKYWQKEEAQKVRIIVKRKEWREDSGSLPTLRSASIIKFP